MQDSYADWMSEVGHTAGMNVLSGRRITEIDVG
jgi:hypothetical protein